jgi:hypothetical protein
MQGQEGISNRADKLKKMIAEIQDQYENLIDSAQLYRKGSLNDKEFLFKLGDYMKSMTAINFLSTQILLDLKTIYDENKHHISSLSLNSQSSSNSSAKEDSSSILNSKPLAHGPTFDVFEPKFKPVTITVENPNRRNAVERRAGRTCYKCGNNLSVQAKFCNKCGNPQ